MTAPAPTAAPAHPSPAVPGLWAGGMSDQIRLPADPITIGGARHFVRHVLTTWRVPQEVTDDMVLIASELATNAVEHTGAATYTVTCTRRAHSVELSVSHSGGPSIIRPREAGSEDEHGRGLAILAALATAWGTSRHHDGTRTWARLNLPGSTPWHR